MHGKQDKQLLGNNSHVKAQGRWGLTSEVQEASTTCQQWKYHQYV